MAEQYRHVTLQWAVEVPDELTEDDESNLLHLVCEDEENVGMEVFGVDINQHGFAGFIPDVDGEFQTHYINVHIKTHLQSHSDHFCIDKSMVEMTESRVREVLPKAAEVGGWHILLHDSR